MNHHLVFVAILVVLCASSVRANLKNICEDSQKFNFDGLKVNSVYILQKPFTFPSIEKLRINDDYEFDVWTCPAVNKTMSQEDVTLYNHHILKIYSESFFKQDVNDFYQMRRYLLNIRDSFIETKQLAAQPTNIYDCKSYLTKLQDIIDRVSDGYQFIEALTTIKENKLSPFALSTEALRQEIDTIPQQLLVNIVFSFRNKILDFYYLQSLLFQSTFTLNRKDPARYLPLSTTGTVTMQLFIPLHDKNYDSGKNCLHLKDLPDFYQSL